MTRVFTPAALVGAAAILLGAPLDYPGNAHVALVSDSGGQGVIAADLLELAGLKLPELSIDTQSNLHRFIPSHAGVANPVDLAGAGETELANYATAVDLVAADESIDVVILSGYFGRYCIDTPDLTEREAAVAVRLAEVAARCCVIVHSMADGGATTELLRKNGVAVFTTIEAAVTALVGGKATAPSPPAHWPGRAQIPFTTALSNEALSNYAQVRELLVAKDVHFPTAVIVPAASDMRTARDAVVSGATAIGGPVLLKATSFQHKTEVDGVVFGLTVDDVESAFDRLVDRLGSTEVTVEQQFTFPKGGIELLVGGRIEAVAGPLIVLAAGGIQAEYLQDSVAALAPVSRAQAADLIGQLRVSRLLAGWRGASRVDLSALIDVVVAVSEVLCDPVGQWSELEINPLIVWPGGCLALDAWGTREGLESTMGLDR